MALLVMVSDQDDAEPPAPPKCQHLGCPALGTEVTRLVRGPRRWDLTHCVEHVDDGLAVARGAGFRPITDPAQPSPSSHLRVVEAFPDLLSETPSRKRSA